jgi:hypothetical protein
MAIFSIIFVSGCTNPPICGNDICDYGENYNDSEYYCPQDCGTPPQECSNDYDCYTCLGNNSNGTSCVNGTCDQNNCHQDDENTQICTGEWIKICDARCGASCENNNQCAEGEYCATETCQCTEESRCIDDDDDNYNVAYPIENTECGILDCDDTNPAINPAAKEVCGNGSDDDCDGAVDCYDADCAGYLGCSQELKNWWPLNDKNGAIEFADIIGNKNGFCIVEGENKCPVSTSEMGGAFQFNGKSNFIDLNTGINNDDKSHEDINIISQKSISIQGWAKINSVKNQAFYFKRGNYSDVGCFLTTKNKSANDKTVSLEFLAYDTTNKRHELIGKTSINANSWHYFACTYDGSTMRLWVDGKEDGNLASKFAITFSDSMWERIGYYDLDGQQTYFDGTINNVAVWNSALSQNEISDIYEYSK